LLLDGAQLSGSATLQESEFDDPLTGRTRSLSGIGSPSVRLDFRHDPPGAQMSWGATYWAPNDSETYFVDMMAEGRGDENCSVFAETTAVAPLRIRLWLRNAGTQRTERLRTWCAPDRSGIVDRTEHRRTRMPMRVTFTVSGQF